MFKFIDIHVYVIFAFILEIMLFQCTGKDYDWNRLKKSEAYTTGLRFHDDWIDMTESNLALGEWRAALEGHFEKSEGYTLVAIENKM